MREVSLAVDSQEREQHWGGGGGFDTPLLISLQFSSNSELCARSSSIQWTLDGTRKRAAVCPVPCHQPNKPLPGCGKPYIVVMCHSCHGNFTQCTFFFIPVDDQALEVNVTQSHQWIRNALLQIISPHIIGTPTGTQVSRCEISFLAFPEPIPACSARDDPGQALSLQGRVRSLSSLHGGSHQCPTSHSAHSSPSTLMHVLTQTHIYMLSSFPLVTLGLVSLLSIHPEGFIIL